MKRRKLVVSALLLLSAGWAGVGSAEQPVAWGPPTGANGCVILREYEQLDVSSSNQNTGTVAKSHFQLSVVTSTGSSLPQTTWPDDQATMNELQRIAIADQTRVVKLRDPYSAEDLAAAQSLCHDAIAASQ
jgi:hypothetical protein